MEQARVQVGLFIMSSVIVTSFAAINILSGQCDPTFGEAFVFGHNVRHSKSQIQENIGLCPQDNVLWSNLSPRDHLWIFGRLRGVFRDQLEDSIEEILQEYHLFDVLDQKVSTFSGGMKRRVSMCVALIGNPRFLVLDGKYSSFKSIFSPCEQSLPQD